MSSVKELLAEMPAEQRERIQKLAASALKLEIGEKALHPLEAIKELVGIKKPLPERMMQYVSEGIQQAKPKAGVAAIGMGAALAAGGAVKLYNEVKFHGALEEMKKDPEVQADPARAVSMAKMVKRWAPSIAADPEILKGTVKNLMKFPDSYLTYDIASKLSQAEKQYQQTHGLLSLLKERLI